MATTASPEIRVYASFPHTLTVDATPDINPTNWHWVHCLTLPLETLNRLQFSRKPYKWIRYAIGVVVGAQGDLSFGPDSPTPVYYEAGLPTESTTLYYHISDEEKQRMLPLDPDMARTTITSSAHTIRRSQFRDDVRAREGGKCVLSGVPERFCDAIHLLAHSKGSPYIKAYTEHRSRDPARGDVVDDIDSVRNGLFLSKFTHIGLDQAIAFITTPNFAMDTADIDSTAQPAERRHTAHLFEPQSLEYLGGAPGASISTSNRLRIANSSQWPPAILFDAGYATTVIHHFGTETFKNATAPWSDFFYPGGVTTVADADYKKVTDERNTAVERRQHQAKDRDIRHQTRQGCLDNMDMLMLMPYLMVPPNEVEAVWREVRDRVKAEEQKCIEEKVNAWQKQVDAA